ncbi:hypothetical protein CYMTET_50371 [Cymbomonas tetramitiformis]|uniref:Uncharacterized protein n=1 Tax=Cymbomonas tetramitiformis TaxID=36881 RepID=A0AAE0BN68_9CHLO|nr:hypothetical protein CYMTET_50371 [Cymbomonas tetramitiformis]
MHAAVRRRVNEYIGVESLKFARLFGEGDLQFHFDQILLMRDPADPNRLQFGPHEREMYARLRDVAPEELNLAHQRRRLQRRAVVFYRGIQRLMNVRVCAAVHALTGAQLGGGWFDQARAPLEMHPDDPIRQEYKRSQVFPHMSDRGSWSYFALKLLSAEAPQTLPPRRKSQWVPGPRSQAHFGLLQMILPALESAG